MGEITYTTFNGRRLNEKDYKTYLEGMAYGIWRTLVLTGRQDGYHKMCDPLTFVDDEKEVFSYVFDLWDGGRHHKYTSLSQVENT